MLDSPEGHGGESKDGREGEQEKSLRLWSGSSIKTGARWHGLVMCTRFWESSLQSYTAFCSLFQASQCLTTSLLFLCVTFLFKDSGAAGRDLFLPVTEKFCSMKSKVFATRMDVACGHAGVFQGATSKVVKDLG